MAARSTWRGGFNGSIRVFPGQSCVFINGGQITGDVNVEGHLGLIGAMVGGNVTVGGAGSFTIAPAAMIGGHLRVKGTSPSDANDSVCGTTIGSNLHLEGSGAAAVRVGSANPLLCTGNRIGGDLVVLDNASAITAFDNTVTGNLVANGNTGLLDVVGNSVGGSLQCRNIPDLIMGGGNKARRIIGQCN